MNPEEIERILKVVKQVLASQNGPAVAPEVAPAVAPAPAVENPPVAPAVENPPIAPAIETSPPIEGPAVPPEAPLAPEGPPIAPEGPGVAPAPAVETITKEDVAIMITKSVEQVMKEIGSIKSKIADTSLDKNVETEVVDESNV